jgi:uncharacterized protein
MDTDLIDAVKAGDMTSAMLMLAAGANVNARDAENSTVLMLAAHMGNASMVRLLIEKGADVNANNESGWAPLAKSVYNPDLKRGFPDIARALIEAGANVEAAIGYGVRPLMLASGYGETAVVQVLLEAGADVLACNEGGYTALMMVKQKHYVDVINLLHEAEQMAGVGEGCCASKNVPGSGIITFMKRTASKE